MPLRKVCRRPETDYRLQQLHAVNEAGPVDQQKIGMNPANVHPIKVTSYSETVPKQQNANIPMAPPLLQMTVSLAPQNMNVDPKKPETTTDVQAGNSIITQGSAAFTGSISTSYVPEVSNQNMAEGK